MTQKLLRRKIPETIEMKLHKEKQNSPSLKAFVFICVIFCARINVDSILLLAHSRDRGHLRFSHPPSTRENSACSNENKNRQFPKPVALNGERSFFK